MLVVGWKTMGRLGGANEAGEGEKDEGNPATVGEDMASVGDEGGDSEREGGRGWYKGMS